MLKILGLMNVKHFLEYNVLIFILKLVGYYTYIFVYGNILFYKSEQQQKMHKYTTF